MNKNFSEENIVIVGISGFATSGKDTFAKIAKNLIINKYFYDSEIFSFADKLKIISNTIIEPNFGINCINPTKEEKQKIRPILVGIGEGFRNIDPFFWVNTVIERINQKNIIKKTFIFIPDVRFTNEAEWIKSKNNGFIISIKRNGVNSPNQQETKNIPIIHSEYSDLEVNWPNIIESEKNILTNNDLNDIVSSTLEKILCQTKIIKT